MKIGNEFLSIAENIAKCYERDKHECNIAKSEGLIRSGISRAYYAAFLIARYVLGLEYLELSKVHRRVVDILKENGHANIADKLAKLREERNNADYDVYRTMQVKTLIWAVCTAKNIIEEILKRYQYYRAL